MIRKVLLGATEDGEQWAPVSDLMAALMLVFMLIAILYIREIVTEEDQNRDKCEEIYKLLESEFRTDFTKWNVQLLEDLTIRFRNPDILFEVGESYIRFQFEEILRNFFPRYMRTIVPHQDDIREIRIEGHTSSEFGEISESNDYIENMSLSQDRAHAILKFILELPESLEYSEWAKPHITANGLSSSHLLNSDGKLISTVGGKEDRDLSRRVEFRLLTASCQKAGIDHRANKKATNEN